jgi:hypothetical protein
MILRSKKASISSLYSEVIGEVPMVSAESALANSASTDDRVIASLDHLSDAELDLRIAHVQAKLDKLKQSGSKGRRIARRLVLEATPRQQEILSCGARFTFTVASRRFGKTTAGILKILTTVAGPAPEAEATVWWVGPTYGQTRKPFRQLIRALRDAGLIEPDNVKRVDLAVEIPSSSGYAWRVEFKSAEKRDNLLGAGLYGLVVDEFGVLPDELWYEVLRPMLADHAGWLFAIGTPRGKRGWGFAGYQRGQDQKENPGYASFKFTWRDAIFIPRSEIDDARRTMPARAFSQEFESEFLDDGTVFQAVKKRRKTPILGEALGIGADWAKRRDYSVFTALGAQSGAVHSIIRLPHQIPYPDQVTMLGRFVAQLKQRGASALYLVHDQTGVGEALDDLLLKAVRKGDLQLTRRLGAKEDPGFEGLVFTNQAKAELVEECALAWESDELGWRPGLLTEDEERACLEFDAFSATFSGTGRVEYGAPEGSHDDYVMSLCLANRARRMIFRRGGMRKPRISSL